MAYSNDIDNIIDSKSPVLELGVPLYKEMEAGTFFGLNLIIKPPKEKVGSF